MVEMNMILLGGLIFIFIAFTALRPTFLIQDQQDAHEFLLLLLSEIQSVLQINE
jgi:uncharacterized UBP type Zn finger protein